MENGAISLIHSEHRFIRDRVDNSRSYWRCRHSFKFNCKARVVTTVVNGYEMMKIRNAEHNHTEIKKSRKGKKRMYRTKKTNAIPRLIRPHLSHQSLPPLMPSRMPKLTPKSIPKVELNPPNDDTENIIVDILD